MVVIAFSSYPPFDSAPFASTPNPPSSVHSLFLTLHHFRCRSSSFLCRLGLFVLFLSIPFWFLPKAQRLACGAPPLLPFQRSLSSCRLLASMAAFSFSMIVSSQSIPEAASSILIFAFYFCCSNVSLSETSL